jgi:hypothetical protein
MLQVAGYVNEFNGEKRVNYTVRSIIPVVAQTRAEQLLTRVNKYTEYI